MDRLLGPDPAADRFLAPRGASSRGHWRTVAVTAAAAAALAVVGMTVVLRSTPLGAGGDPSSAGGAAAVRSSSPRAVTGHDIDCTDGGYTKSTLKLVTEEPVVRLISERSPDGSGAAVPIGKFEASDVAGVAGGSHVFVVFDNSFKIGHFASGLTYVAPDGGEAETNKLLTWPDDDGSDSQFEALTYNATSGTYLVIQESVINASGSMVPRIMEVSLGGDAAQVHSSCDGAFTFASENKGFEGAAIATAADGTSYLLALCEGNYCAGGKDGRKPGHGRIIVMAREATPGGGCVWVPRQTVAIPKSAYFMDYSAISIFNNTRVAVSSQENAAVWIGQLELLDGSRLSPDHDHRVRGSHRGSGEAMGDDESALFALSGGKVYDFPRNDQCQRIFCTIEVRCGGGRCARRGGSVPYHVTTLLWRLARIGTPSARDTAMSYATTRDAAPVAVLCGVLTARNVLNYRCSASPACTSPRSLPWIPCPLHSPLERTTPLLPQGIHWQEADKLVAVSDKMKSGGKQPFICMTHDQSIHTFLIPA